MEAFGALVGSAERAVFIWSMGITQHEAGEDAVRQIINLALLRGFVGREGCGLMPIRGHSGVQGGAEMGAYATALPGGRPVNADSAEALSATWGFPVPSEPGMTAPELMDAAARGEVDLLYSIGGNLLDVLPGPGEAAAALGRVALRVHHDIVLSGQMLVEPADTVLILPAMTRYEIPGGVTSTSTERRVIFSPEVPGPRVQEARHEGEVLMAIARSVDPRLHEALSDREMADVRAEIAEVVPFYRGIEALKVQGDAFQYGGPHLLADRRFGTPDGRAHFAAVPIPDTRPPDGRFRLTTRRGKQFNSMVHEDRDPLTGAARDAVLMSPEDAEALGLVEGDAVELRSAFGCLSARVHRAPSVRGALQVHWPEGNVLLDPRARAPKSQVPDYTVEVTLSVLSPR